MFSILFVLILQSSGFEINLTTLYPSFKSYDNGPYLDTLTRSSSELYLSISTEVHLDLYLNYNFLLSLNSSSNISITLTPGFNTLTILSAQETQILIPYSNQTVSSHTVALANSKCNSFDCGLTNETLVKMTVSSLGYIARMFSLKFRNSSWQQMYLNYQNLFMMIAGENYLMVQNGAAAMVYKVYKVLNSTQLAGITVGSEEFYLEPRFSPVVGEYFVRPKVDFSQRILNFLTVSGGSNSSITFSSFLGAFVDFTVMSGTAVNISIGFPDDLITLSIKSGTSINYYSLKFTSKSRDKYLKRLDIYSDSPGPLLGYQDIELCCNLSKVFTNEDFTLARTSYTISDRDYSSVPITIIAEPSDASSIILLQNESYLLSSKSFIPEPGLNTLKLTVQAEDPSFYQDYQISFYVKNNDSSIGQLVISNLQPSFSPTILTYRSYLPFETTSIPIFIQSSDPNSSIKLVNSALVQLSNNSLSTTVSFNSLTTTIFITVSAETLSLASIYSITFIKQDKCGNGLRFTNAESCDDGNLINNDGCSNQCSIESGWTCSGGSQSNKDTCTLTSIDPEDPVPVCGNNIKEKGEECDSIKDIQCVNCKIVKSVCGNNILEKGEECDDGNNVNDDGCTHCKIDSNGEICGDGLRPPFSSEECDDGNNISDDGCTNCKIDLGWTCSGNSALTDVINDPDKCWKNEESSEASESANNTEESSTINENESGDKEENSNWDNFGYIGTACFFITITASVVLIIGIYVFGEKLGMGIIPGILFPVFVFQVIFCFESNAKDFKEFFRSFGWSHLHFYQPIKISSRRAMDILSTQVDSTPIFLENIQYWIFLLCFLICANFVIWFLIPKPSLLKSQKSMYFYFYLLSLIPLLYFSLLSLSNPDISDSFSIISYILSALFMALYLAVLAYFVFALYKYPLGSSVVYDLLTTGLKKDKRKITRQRTDDSKVEEIVPSAPERMSLDENSARNEEDLQTGRKIINKYDPRVQSAPISVYKYEPPEREESIVVEEIQFPWLCLVEIGGFCCIAIELAIFKGVEIVGYCLGVVILASILSVLAYRPVFLYGCYKFVHIWVVFFLTLISGVLLSTDNVILGSVHYFTILTVISIVALYIHQFVVILLEWIQIDNVVIKEYSGSHQDVSISYVKDSIPEEKAPGSATINNISYDISMSVLRD